MGWRSGQAYSQDLRERILAAVDGGMSVREAATLFRVSISYMYKAMIRCRRTGETAAAPSTVMLARSWPPIMTRSGIGYWPSRMRRWTNCGPGCSQVMGCR
jgi:hypothetical protein